MGFYVNRPMKKKSNNSKLLVFFWVHFLVVVLSKHPRGNEGYAGCGCPYGLVGAGAGAGCPYVCVGCI